MKSMRAVWLSMRDEEPPAAGMSALLAAAREKADKMHAESTWWQRAVAAVRRPPALAFATVVILIGGAVVVTRTSDRPVDATLESTAPALPALAGPAKPALPEPMTERAYAPAVAVRSGPPSTPPGEATGGTEPRAERVSTAALKDGSRTPPKRRTLAKPKAVDAVATLHGGETEGGFALEGEGELSSQPRSDLAPELATTKPTDAADAAGAAKQTGNGARLSPLEQLARQAESAASRSDCPAVRTIVMRIKNQDSSFYKTRFGNHATISKCLE
jgi:hypothetical protein